MNTPKDTRSRFVTVAATIVGCILWIAPLARSAEPDAPAPLAPSFSVNLLDIQPGSTGSQPVARHTSVRLRGYGIYSAASGSMNFGDNVEGVANTLHLEDTLGMDLKKFSGGVLLGFNLGAEKRLHVDISYDSYYNYKGNKDVGSIAFDGQVFNAIVSSSAELMEGGLTIGYDIYRADSTGLTVTPTLGMRLFYIDAQLSEDASSTSASVQLWAPIPELGCAIRWDITPNIYVRGAVAGIYAGELAAFGEFTAEVGFDLNANVGAFVGYRAWVLDINFSDDEYNFNTSSIYAGVELRL